MKLIRGAALTLLASILSAPVSLAWTPETRVRMVDEAIRLMPYSLRLALERHREDVRRGMLEPMLQEDGEEHRPPWWDGTLDAAIAARARALVEAVDSQASFSEISRRFGELAHFVADAGFPPGAGGKAGNGHYAHFSKYCGLKLEKFPLVFYGHEDPGENGNDFRAFARSVLDRARAEDRELARAYAAAGDRPKPIAFDDRSIPFAIGSLSYSNSVTDVVRAWMRAWRLAHGDTGRTPYLKRSTETRHDGGQ